MGVERDEWVGVLSGRVYRDVISALSPAPAICSTEETGCVPGSGEVASDDPSVERLSVRPNRTSRHRSESSVELGIAIQALQNAREGADALRPGMLPHQRDAVLCDPLSQINLARRSLDAVERRWKRGGQ